MVPAIVSSRWNASASSLDSVEQVPQQRKAADTEAVLRFQASLNRLMLCCSCKDAPARDEAAA